MHSVGQIVRCDGFGGVIIMKVVAPNSTEYTIELPCKLYVRVTEDKILGPVA